MLRLVRPASRPISLGYKELIVIIVKQKLETTKVLWGIYWWLQGV